MTSRVDLVIQTPIDGLNALAPCSKPYLNYGCPVTILGFGTESPLISRAEQNSFGARLVEMSGFWVRTGEKVAAVLYSLYSWRLSGHSSGEKNE
jgi:hypothetical protein